MFFDLTRKKNFAQENGARAPLTPFLYGPDIRSKIRKPSLIINTICIRLNLGLRLTYERSSRGGATKIEKLRISGSVGK